MKFELLTPENTTEKLFCQICGESCSVIIKHIREKHPELVGSDLDFVEAQYKRVFPDAALYNTESYSALMKKLGREEPVQVEKMAEQVEKKVTNKSKAQDKSGPLKAPQMEAKSTIDGSKLVAGTVKIDSQKPTSAIPAVDKNYLVPDLEYNLLHMAVCRNTPAYFFGLPGNGKTSLVEQYCAMNEKPMIRVQHSGGLEDYEILGTERIGANGSYFAEGLLPMAMRLGYVYLADEYDFAQASVLAVYQSVLEGKPLVLRGANNGTNVITPHPDFRFVALGNTNGAGDETGLFQGTKLQNAANMERFSVVHHMTGLTPEQETAIVLKKTEADKRLASEVEEFVGLVRKAYEEGRISNTIGGIRVILNIVNNGIDMGDMKLGAMLAFGNRLPGRDAQLVSQIAQRIWG